MPSLKRVSISGPNFFETIVKPSFGDLIENRNVMNGYFGEFMVMDDVPFQRKIIDIRPLKNILKRRDASCAGVFDPIMRSGLRNISVTELDAGVKFCREEFYQGCLKDWRDNDPVFYDKIVVWFKNAVAQDLMSLMYFGDVTAAPSANHDDFNINQFDGIYTQYAKYIADGTIPGSQTFNIASAPMTPTNAKLYLENLFSKQDAFMTILPASDKVITINTAWANGYEDYLIATGQYANDAANFVQDGIRVRAYKGIPILVNPFFDPILAQTVGANAHYGVLTLRGNFVFATDSSYGLGPNGDQALAVWYSWDEDTWKWRMALKAGTQIALPEHSVLGLPV